MRVAFPGKSYRQTEVMWRLHAGGVSTPRMLAYAVAGGISLVGHAALIWYGSHVTAPASLPHADAKQMFAIRLIAENKSVFDNQAHADVRKLNSGDGQYSSVMDKAAPERMFPAFYGVHYYEPKELTQKPLVTQDIPRDFALHVPNAPDNAAIFLLLINEYGTIDKVIVESSSLPQAAQTELEDAFKAIKFFPGQMKGMAVKSALKIQIRLDAETATK